MKLSLSLLSLGLSIIALPANAYKLTLYTDQKSQEAAKGIINEFKTNYPFNLFQIDFNIVTIDKSLVTCTTDPAAPRSRECNFKELSEKHIAPEGVDQAIFVKESNEWFGSETYQSFPV